MNKVLPISPLTQNAQNLNDYKFLLPTHTEIPPWFQMDLQGESSFVLSINKWTLSSLPQLWLLLPKAKSSPKQSLIISMPFPGGEWVDCFPSASVSPCCALPCRTLTCFSHLHRATKKSSCILLTLPENWDFVLLSFSQASWDAKEEGLTGAQNSIGSRLHEVCLKQQLTSFKWTKFYFTW